MNEELVQVGERTDPADAEEPRRRARPSPIDEPREIMARGKSYPSALGEALERTRQHEAGRRDQITLAQDEVCREIARGPSVEQRGRGRSELVEKITERASLLPVEGEVAHPGATYV